MNGTAPFYGFPCDVVEPPDGGYSFIEWEDLDSATRVHIAMRHVSVSMSGTTEAFKKFGVSITEAVQKLDPNRNTSLHFLVSKALDSKEAETLVQTAALDDLTAKWEAQESRKAAEKAAAEIHLHGVEGMKGRYLLADPGEIAQIMQRMDTGIEGRKVFCTEPLPAWTCVRYNERRMADDFVGHVTGVRPGSISTGITVTNAEYYSEKYDTAGNRVVAYETRIFVKS